MGYIIMLRIQILVCFMEVLKHVFLGVLLLVTELNWLLLSTGFEGTANSIIGWEQGWISSFLRCSCIFVLVFCLPILTQNKNLLLLLLCLINSLKCFPFSLAFIVVPDAYDLFVGKVVTNVYVLLFAVWHWTILFKRTFQKNMLKGGLSMRV